MATILLIDDDQMVQSVTRELLELSGYTVLSAENGSQAMTLAADSQTQIDLVLLDLSLPDMEGLELLHHLTTTRSGLKIVICTGNLPGDLPLREAHPEIKGFLQKPFNLPTLQQTVRDGLAV